MPVKKLKEYLDANNIKYVTIIHSKAYTAQTIAASAHISGDEIAKTVMIRIDGKMAMAVLPASYRVDFNKLQKTIGANKVDLAREQEFIEMFPNCQVGTMPPFGNLWGMEVYVAESLTRNEDIAFQAGYHTELIRLSYKDFERLVKPKVIQYSFKEHLYAW